MHLLDSISWDDWNLTGVASVATDPVNPNNVYIAAGTYTNDWDDSDGAILRSSDRGVNVAANDVAFQTRRQHARSWCR